MSQGLGTRARPKTSAVPTSQRIRAITSVADFGAWVRKPPLRAMRTLLDKSTDVKAARIAEPADGELVESSPEVPAMPTRPLVLLACAALQLSCAAPPPG